MLADRAAIDGARLTQPRLQHALDQLDGQLPLLQRALATRQENWGKNNRDVAETRVVTLSVILTTSSAAACV